VKKFSFNANQVIYAYGANSSVDDDVKYDKDSVEDREYILPLISELNTGWSNKENFFTQISQNQIRFLMQGEKIFLKKIFLFSVYKENRTVFPFCRKIW
jgi:hypothetical protein